MDSNGILAIAALAISVCGSILAVINHRRLRSNCNGNEVVISLDVEATTPPEKALKIKLPASPKPSAE